MRLKHFSGKIVELTVCSSGGGPLVRVGKGDFFGPMIFRMMFDISKPGSIVEMSTEERELMIKGDFFD